MGSTLTGPRRFAQAGSTYRNSADFRYGTVQWPGFNGLESTPKDTKTKGFIP